MNTSILTGLAVVTTAFVGSTALKTNTPVGMAGVAPAAIDQRWQSEDAGQRLARARQALPREWVWSVSTRSFEQMYSERGSRNQRP